MYNVIMSDNIPSNCLFLGSHFVNLTWTVSVIEGETIVTYMQYPHPNDGAWQLTEFIRPQQMDPVINVSMYY